MHMLGVGVGMTFSGGFIDMFLFGILQGNAKKEATSDATSRLIMRGLGGKKNISDVDCCATRLRTTVFDPSLVKEELFKENGAAGVIKKGDGVQVIYGPKVTVIKSNLEDFLQSPDSDKEECRRQPEDRQQNH